MENEKQKLLSLQIKFAVTDPTDGKEYFFTINRFPSISTFEEMRPTFDSQPLTAGEIWVDKEWVNGDSEILTRKHLRFQAAALAMANWTWIKGRVIDDVEITKN